MTTVGYGDFYPSSRMGQGVVVIAILCGNLLTSLIIVALTNASEFTTDENRAFLILKRIQIRKTLKSTAQKIIKLNYQMKMMRNDDNFTDVLIERKYNEMYRKLCEMNHKKIKLLKELAKDTFVTQEEKLDTLRRKIETNLTAISNSIEILNQFKSKIKIELDIQSDILSTLRTMGGVYRNEIEGFVLRQGIRPKEETDVRLNELRKIGKRKFNCDLCLDSLQKLLVVHNTTYEKIHKEKKNKEKKVKQDTKKGTTHIQKRRFVLSTLSNKNVGRVMTGVPLLPRRGQSRGEKKSSFLSRSSSSTDRLINTKLSDIRFNELSPIRNEGNIKLKKKS